MNKKFGRLIAGGLLLSSSALWALGGHVVWTAERIMAAALALAIMGFVVYL